MTQVRDASVVCGSFLLPHRCRMCVACEHDDLDVQVFVVCVCHSVTAVGKVASQCVDVLALTKFLRASVGTIIRAE